MIMDWLPIDLVWRGALVVVPAALLVALIGGVCPCRPSTRHAMWLVVLLILVATPFVPRIDFGQLPVGPSADLVQTPRTESAPRREQEAIAPTVSSGPPAAVFFLEPTRQHGNRPTMPPAPIARPVELPVAPEPVPVPRQVPGLATSGVPEWLVRLDAVRTAVLSLAPIPAAVWLGGILLLLVVGAVRIARASRLVRNGSAAPPSVVRMVETESRRLGLRRSPAIVMVDGRISPMLFCGRRVTLVLPRRLWRQLDEIGRRAVICHELAHLRRRDHWVCWIDMIVGWIYWWHPVVWWIRRRLGEEADLCCDTWVTTLLPNGRRAYAQALLEARRCGSRTSNVAPSVGLGATTRRARRFARRLTMVMTSHTSPGISRKGTLLACVLGLGGILVTPLWACPDAPRSDTSARTVRAPRAPRAPLAPLATMPPLPDAMPGSETTFEQFMQGREGEPLEHRMQELERRLERMHRELERMLHEPRSHGGDGGVLGLVRAESLGRLLTMYGAAVGQSKRHRDSCIKNAAVSTGPIVIRKYELAGGKREALIELMVRDDVPIRVRSLDDGIEVHATEGQQCLFEAFVMMIGTGETEQEYELSEGKLEALTGLMVRSDVPIFVSPGERQITLHGTELEQAVFGAFVRMIQPGDRAAGSRDAPEALAYSEALAGLASQYESQAHAQVAGMRGLQAALRALAQQGRNFDRQSDRLYEKADRLRDKADSVRDDADELRDDADELQGKTRESAMKRAEKLLRKAEEILQAAESIDQQAEMLEQQAQQIEQQAEQIEQQIDELDELADRGAR